MDYSRGSMMDVIRDAVGSEPIGEGCFSFVYDFPKGSGFENYVLKTNRDFNKNALLSSTSLTKIDPYLFSPVPDLICDIHIGQPLLSSEDGKLSILLKQKGKSLIARMEAYKLAYGDNPNADGLAMTRLVEDINKAGKAHGINPFKALFLNGYRSAYSGYFTDFRASNIFLEEGSGKLIAVDQHMKPSEDFTKILANEIGNNTQQRALYLFELAAHQLLLFFEAYKPSTHTLRSAKALAELKISYFQAKAEVEQYPSRLGGLQFASVKDVKAARADHPPKTFLDTLEMLRSRANLSLSY